MSFFDFDQFLNMGLHGYATGILCSPAFPGECFLFSDEYLRDYLVEHTNDSDPRYKLSATLYFKTTKEDGVFSLFQKVGEQSPGEYCPIEGKLHFINKPEYTEPTKKFEGQMTIHKGYITIAKSYYDIDTSLWTIYFTVVVTDASISYYTKKEGLPVYATLS